jgi:lysophospholipase L1-like esterase
MNVTRSQVSSDSRKKWTSFFKAVAVVFVFFVFVNTSPSSDPITGVSKTSSDPYETRMCNPRGTRCGEDPDVPSPRTIYSAKSKEQYDLWWIAHTALNQSASAYAAHRTRTQQDPSSKSPNLRSLILLGDSITESWLGMNMGRYDPRTQGVPDVLKKHLSHSQNLNPLVLAIGGDQTQHLLYRLQHGQLLPDYAHDPKAVFAMMIGTNNLGSGFLPDATTKGILKVANYVLENTKGHLIILEVLPRGDVERLPAGRKFKSFMPAIDKVNAAVREEISKMKETHGTKRVGVLDCGQPFRAKSADVDASLMPDLLHPNADGHELLAQCMLDYIKAYIKDT